MHTDEGSTKSNVAAIVVPIVVILILIAVVVAITIVLVIWKFRSSNHKEDYHVYEGKNNAELLNCVIILILLLYFFTIAPPDSTENISKVSTTNPAFAKHEHADGGEIGSGDLHRGESNLSIDKENQEYVNKVPEDNASNTLGDSVQRVVQDENGFESAAEDQPNSNQSGDDHSNVAKSDNPYYNVGGGIGALSGYAGDVDDDDHGIVY